MMFCSLTRQHSKQLPTQQATTYEPRSGKSALMNELMAEFVGKSEALAETIIGNCTTTIPLRFNFDE